jgi:hypothetical protein
MEICIKESIPEENPMAMGSTTGRTPATSREILNRALERVMGCGKRDQVLVTNIRAST